MKGNIMPKSTGKQPQSYLAKVHRRLLTKRKQLQTDLNSRMVDVHKIQAQLDSLNTDIKALEKVA